MPLIDTLKSKYFVTAADATPPTEPVPAEFQDCLVTPLIDCVSYNTEIRAALDLVGTGANEVANAGHFVLIANWWLGLSGGEYVPAAGSFDGNLLGSAGPTVVDLSPFYLDGPLPTGGTLSLLDLLKAKARLGVDVRVLGWISFAVADSTMAAKSGAETVARINALTLQSIKDLRAEEKIGAKAVLNLIGHTAGSAHMKLVIIGTNTEAIGFTGGIDFVLDRWAYPGHVGKQTWHDTVAKVEGPAVQALYDWFAAIWRENIARPVRTFRLGREEITSCLPRAPTLDPRALPTTPKGKHHVQSLRTAPAFNYEWYNCLPENPPISFAPTGLFEFRTALYKAVSNAETYIYIEDEFFWSQEILTWVGEAIKGNAVHGPRPALRVILVTGGGVDPNDPHFPEALLANSINDGLLKDLSAAQKTQVRMFRRMGDRTFFRDGLITAVTITGGTSEVTTGLVSNKDMVADVLRSEKHWIVRQGGNEFPVLSHPATAAGEILKFTVQNLPGGVAPVAGAFEAWEWQGIFVHSKTVLVDDECAIIGSNNVIRRSLYSDLEHAVSVLDEDNLVVKEYRKALWADHFRHGSPNDFDDIQSALHAWDSSWGVAGTAPPRPELLIPIDLPIVTIQTFDGAIRERYDRFTDIDSREDWGGLCP